MAAFKFRQIHVAWNVGYKEFRRLHNPSHLGLGQLKNCSMIHHIETLAISWMVNNMIGTAVRAVLGDNGLKKNIITFNSPDFGDCSYCGTKGIEIIEPHALFDHFSSLINIYENHPDGKV